MIKMMDSIGDEDDDSIGDEDNDSSDVDKDYGSIVDEDKDGVDDDNEGAEPPEEPGELCYTRPRSSPLPPLEAHLVPQQQELRLCTLRP